MKFLDRIPRIIWRDKLTHKGAPVWGLYDPNTGDIEMHKRQRGRRMLETFVHEFLHHIFPDWTEEQVTPAARRLSRFLWAMGWRRQVDGGA